MTIERDDLEYLLHRISKGDQRAFALLYRLTSAKLFGLILRICRDRGLAEDVLQDTCVRIWRNAPLYSAQSGRPITWMAAIARHAAIDALRSRNVRDARLTDGDDAQLAAVPDLVGGAVDPMDREALRRCLGQLDAEQRDCVLLAYHEGLSREELAERFTRPVGTIKTWLHRALNQLKSCLGAT
ncbi:RNA polymerase sigma factor [Oryzibacter oryziterrae]|uniref:RNA polymerase sigma factor n=1 Tax=Oryzibacter oryziterrae TaxID=2766474 RepID=UPI001F018FCF|nr:sigma-70 family RNA polymerase sigma factor [Oryzibacter oryziterrae]